jgi:hypothetical protein
VIFALSRVFSTALLIGMFVIAQANHLAFAGARSSTSLFAYFGSWDATFYRHIAGSGYPETLPTAAGHVVPNEWAFLPVYPVIARGLTDLTSLEFDTTGVIVSILCGAGAAVILAYLLGPRVGRGAALWTVAAFAFGPVAFVLQLPYAESLFCLLVFSALLSLRRRQYALVTGFGVLAAFTRPGELALPLALGILFILRLRHPREFLRSERIRMLVAGLVTAAAGFVWPIVAGLVTGDRNAYVDTELSWWTGFVGRPGFTPFTPFFLMAGTYLGAAGIVLVVLVIAATGLWLTRRRMRALGPEILLFGGSYLVYLVAVFLPQQSIFRLLLPATPLLGDPRLSTSKRARWVFLGAGILLQPIAVYLCWFIGYP